MSVSAVVWVYHVETAASEDKLYDLQETQLWHDKTFPVDVAKPQQCL